MTTIHGMLANSVLLFCFIAGLWGITSYFRKRGIDGNYWGILAVGEILIIAQGVVGVLLWLSEARPAREIHALYGGLTMVAFPALYSLTRGRDDRRAALAYGALSLLLVLLSFRATLTA